MDGASKVHSHGPTGQGFGTKGGQVAPSRMETKLVDSMRRAPRLAERLEALSGFVDAAEVRPILEVLRSPLVAAP
jgi:hypothetical protein